MSSSKTGGEVSGGDESKEEAQAETDREPNGKFHLISPYNRRPPP
jgi:hypothetical protein